MGDRISFSFQKDGYESIAFYSHWDGKGIKECVEDYFKELKKEIKGQQHPIDRLEPGTVMLDFIRWFCLRSGEIVKEGRVKGNYYLKKDGFCGDNSDNGHHVFDLGEGVWY